MSVRARVFVILLNTVYFFMDLFFNLFDFTYVFMINVNISHIVEMRSVFFIASNKLKCQVFRAS